MCKMKCPMCGEECKYYFVDDGVCYHWDRILTLEEIEELKEGLLYEKD